MSMYRRRGINSRWPLSPVAAILMVALSLLLPQSSVAAAVDYATGIGPVSAAASGAPGNALDSVGTNDGAKLLQFTSAGHVLGFNQDGVIIASVDHMLKTEFFNSNLVAPEADHGVSGKPAGSAVPALSQVAYQNVWDGVTVVYTASPGAIVESSYYLNPVRGGIPVDSIRVVYNRPVYLDENGNLVIAYENGTIMEAAPVAWQEIDGQRQPATAAYVLYGDRELGFALDNYMPGIPVVIDPAITWNTFLGGSGSDYGRAIAVDGSGNVYVSGYSFGTWGSPVRAYTPSGYDAFAAKLNSSGSLQWNTFLGGSGHDYGYAIAVDSGGNVYVGGSSDATWGSPVRAYTPSDADAFAAKLLASSGALVWNTFLGGSGDDYGNAIAVDGSGNVYVGGFSDATWPVPSALSLPVRAYTSKADAFAAKLNSSGSLQWNTFLGGSDDDYGNAIAVDGGNVYVGGSSYATWPVPSASSLPVRGYTSGVDAFAAKLDSATGVLQWNTFLGGSGDDRCNAITVDGSGNVYVGGWSNATWGSPVRAYTPSVSAADAFAAKLDSSGSLQWNTFLGGSGFDYGFAIAVDGSGNVYVGGYSYATWGSPVRAYTPSVADAFAAKLDSSGSLQWNTFLGGSGIDYGFAIAVDGSGNVYVGGYTYTTWGSPVRAYTPSVSAADAFAAKLNSSGSLQWNTFLGGSGNDYGYAIAVDSSTNVYVGGSSDATWGSPVRAYTSSGDAFAAKLTYNPDLAITKSDSPDPVIAGNELTYTIVVTNNGLTDATSVSVNDTLLSGVTFKSADTHGNGTYNSGTGVWTVGGLANGASATLTLWVTVNSPAVDRTLLTNTAEVTGDLTDPDMTNNIASQNTTVSAPNMQFTKTVELSKDVDGDGVPSPGDTLKYTAVIHNTGHAAATGVDFSDTPDPNTALVNGTVTKSQGSVLKGNQPGDTTVEVSLGAIPAGGTAVITFEVMIRHLWFPWIFNQAITTGTNFASVMSDDPNTAQPNDPTVIEVKTSPGVPGISQWGILAIVLLFGGAMVWVIRRRQVRSETQ